ncbi:hypothetical protein [Nocardia shimofusensis]|nr:hypothetical protein [Nocardia shimofusensis]
MEAELSAEAEHVAKWKQRVRIFGILVTAVPSVVVAVESALREINYR